MLIACVLVAVSLARRGKLVLHCTLIRGSIVAQIFAIFIVMLPSLLGYVENVPLIPLLYPELLFHHILGLLLIFIFIYVNFDVAHVVSPIVKSKNIMRTALGVWLVAIIVACISILRSTTRDARPELPNRPYHICRCLVSTRGARR